MAAPALDRIDKRLLDQLQAEVPLAPRPYAELGKRQGLSAEEVRRRIAALREARIIRQISAIFDSRKLGYHSSLAAFEVEESRLLEVVRRINAHPGVSHNYQRDFPYNLWFTIAVPPGGDLEAEVNALANQPGVRRLRLLPTLTVFKVGVVLGMDEEAESGGRSVRVSAPETARRYAAPTPEEIEAIRILQKDLPTVDRPFAQLAAQRGQTEDAVLEQGRAFLADGRMRRFAAVLHHREAGFTHNAMVLWNAPEAEVERIGRIMASFEAVSHCYRRPSFADLPFNIYTMVHGRAAEECERAAAGIAAAVGLADYRVVYSTREFKKVRVRYFEEETAEAVRTEKRTSSAAGNRGGSW